MHTAHPAMIRFGRFAFVLPLIFCFCCLPAIGDEQGKKKNADKQSKTRQEKQAARSVKKKKKQTERNKQSAQKPEGSIPPAERSITDEQVARAAANIDRLVVADLKKNDMQPAPAASELVLLRRVYLDTIGRIPTADEMDQYFSSKGSDRLNNLIDKLLDSSGHRSHLFNYFADMLRISDEFYRVGSTHTYQSWLKKQIRENRPWNEMVTDLMTAEGPFGSTGAAGYLLRDAGMPLDSLSNTLTTFMGANVACAQCHDHPFADWSQDDFYKMAAFFGSTRFERDDSRKPARTMATKEFAKSTLVTFLRPTISRVVFEKGRSLKYPEDYQYDDELPGKKVKPEFITWADTPSVPVAKIAPQKSLRKQFADWMTAKDNPRFASAIANRMWKRFFGAGVQEPITDLDEKDLATNPELLAFLSKLMVAVDFDLREFQRVLLRTNIYRRQACKTPAEGVAFRFPGPMLRRMSAEQAWDSIVVLNVGTQREDYVRDYGDKQAELVIPKFVVPAKKEAWDDASLQEQVFAHARTVLKQRGVSEGKAMSGGRGLFASESKYRGVKWDRASELTQPEKPSHLLRIAGQSDRKVADDSATEGGITESLAMMNGEASETVIGDDSMVMKQAALRSQHADKVEYLYRSFLTRKPSEKEKQICDKVFDLRMGIRDIAWSLLNSREFMFIQ